MFAFFLNGGVAGHALRFGGEGGGFPFAGHGVALVAFEPHFEMGFVAVGDRLVLGEEQERTEQAKAEQTQRRSLRISYRGGLLRRRR